MSSRSGIRWAAEGMALMLATAGAAVVAYLDLPDPERVEAPIASAPERMRLFEIELVELPRPPKADEPLCSRGYSSSLSDGRIDGAMVQEFVEFVCADRADCAPIAPETAICVAEERFLGEGRARGITYVANPFAWVVSGSHQRVFVDAHTGDAVAINYAHDERAPFDEMEADVRRALGR